MKLITELDGVRIGGQVFYRYNQTKWVPAIIETIYPREKDKPLAVAMVIFLTGFHGSTSPVSRAYRGNQVGEWLSFNALKEFLADPSPAETDVQEKQLAALRELEALAKAEQEKKQAE